MSNNNKIFFISKDATWQKYRLDVLTKLGEKYDFQITVLTTGKLKDYIKSYGFVKYLIFKNLFPQNLKPSFFPGALFYIIKNRPNTIICLNNTTQLTEYFALFLSRILKIKFVWWTHGYDHDTLGKNKLLLRLKEYYQLFFLKLGNRIITFSDKGKDYLSKYIYSKKIIVAHNTLDTEKLQERYNYLNQNYAKDEIREKLGFNRDDFVILFSGRLNEKKKVEDGIKVVKRLVENNEKVKFVIIGDGEQRKNLENIATPLLNKNIIFIGPLFDDNKLSEYFYCADIFLMPGYVGLAIIHAFSFGLPIVTENTYNHGPEIEYLENGKNGFMVAENDLKELKEKISFLINNRDELKKMSRDALSVVNEKGNINNLISQMAKAIFE